MNVAELIERGERMLVSAGVVCAHGTDNCRDEAAALIYHVLGLDHADPTAYDQRISTDGQERCMRILDRRIRERLPAAYLTGEAWFAGLPFQVDRRVLVPRSPFAELIEACFEPWLAPRAMPRILEVGTGSGCIAIACALAFSGAQVVATDISRAALDVARHNVDRHGVGDRVQLLCADLLRGLRGQFDLIVSNPPYVPDAEIPDLPPEFGCEPRGALAGGADGLSLVRLLIDGASALLAPDGVLAVEVGAGAHALETAFPGVSFIWPEFARGGDGIALVAAADLPRHNASTGATGRSG